MDNRKKDDFFKNNEEIFKYAEIKREEERLGKYALEKKSSSGKIDILKRMKKLVLRVEVGLCAGVLALSSLGILIYNNKHDGADTSEVSVTSENHQPSEEQTSDLTVINRADGERVAAERVSEFVVENSVNEDVSEDVPNEQKSGESEISEEQSLEESKKIDEDNFEESQINVEDSSEQSEIGEVDDFVDSESSEEENFTEQEENIDSNEEYESIDEDDIYSSVREEVREFLDNTEAGYYVKLYSDMYGIDPHIMAAICRIESLTLNHEDCIPGGQFYTSYGVGITMLDFDKDLTEQEEIYVTGYNYLTGETDRVRLNMANAVDLEKNIQISCMLFQDSINAMQGNILLAIQCHNYSKYMVNHVLDVNGLLDSITDFSDVRWKDAMLDAHLHPYKYLSSDVWDYETYGEYGGRDYVDTVLSICEPTARYQYNDTIYTLDLKNSCVVDEEYVGLKQL